MKKMYSISWKTIVFARIICTETKWWAIGPVIRVLLSTAQIWMPFGSTTEKQLKEILVIARLVKDGAGTFNTFFMTFFFSLFFQKNRIWQWRQLAWNVKSCFLGKLRTMSICRLMKFFPRVLSVNIGYEPQRQETYLRICAHSEDADQPAHSRSLIILFTGRILDSQRCSVFMRTTKTLVRLCGCAGWFESSLGAYVRRYVSSSLL